MLINVNTFLLTINIFVYFRYETKLLFVLWAHVVSNHPKDNCEKKSCSYCFLCNRTLNKRTTMLKHLNRCIVGKLAVPTNAEPSIEFKCGICSFSCDALLKLEEHSWVHM